MLLAQRAAEIRAYAVAYADQQVRAAEAPLRQRIAELELQTARVRCCYAGSVRACPIHEQRQKVKP